MPNVSGANRILRTIYLSPQLDFELQSRASRANTSSNELMQKYLALGIQCDDDRDTAERQNSCSADEYAPHRG